MFSINYKSMMDHYVHKYNLKPLVENRWRKRIDNNLIKICKCDGSRVHINLYRDINNILTLKFVHDYSIYIYLFRWNNTIDNYVQTIEDSFGSNNALFTYSFCIPSDYTELAIKNFVHSLTGANNIKIKYGLK